MIFESLVNDSTQKPTSRPLKGFQRKLMKTIQKTVSEATVGWDMWLKPSRRLAKKVKVSLKRSRLKSLK